MTLSATRTEQQIARPLRVLVPLIQDDLKLGKEASERAGMPYYQSAGEKLLEAKSQMDHGKFLPWIKRNFSIKERQARTYMELAEHTKTQIGSAMPFSSLGDFIRKTGPDPNYNTFASKKGAWVGQVNEIIESVDTETLNLKRADLARADEREAQKDLALQLIDIGYKVLARTLHPDKGGSKVAMSRLNAVRDRLKQSA